MNHRLTATGAGALLITCGSLLTPADASASDTERDAIRLAGVIRDFKANDPVFPDPSADPFVCGIVATTLGESGDPVATGEGFIVRSPAYDVSGASINPALAAEGAAIDDFEIIGGQLLPASRYTAKITLLGAAIQNDSYHIPVTTRIRVGDQVFQPFGAFDSPVAGNVNDNQSATGNSNTIPARDFILPDLYASDTAITVDGRSWDKDSGTGREDHDWSVDMQCSSYDASPQVRVLRHGDPVPNINGAYDQASIDEYVKDFVDSDSQTMRLDANQVIWLFELGLNASHSSADFQDLVIVVTLATDPSYFNDRPTTPCGGSIADAPATLGEPSNAGLNQDNLKPCFTTIPAVNVSSPHAITLIDSGNGYFEFNADDFTPIDDRLYGNEDREHNRSFTYEIHANFVYDECAGQMFEFTGHADVWAFVNGKLAMDLGGPGFKTQRIDMDRLGLTHAEDCKISFFYLNRNDATSAFNVKTNIQLRNSAVHLPTSVLLAD